LAGARRFAQWQTRVHNETLSSVPQPNQAATQNRLFPLGFYGCFDIVAEPALRVGTDHAFSEFQYLVKLATLVMEIDQSEQVINILWLET
jgi:hypothetical protein